MCGGHPTNSACRRKYDLCIEKRDSPKSGICFLAKLICFGET